MIARIQLLLKRSSNGKTCWFIKMSGTNNVLNSLRHSTTDHHSAVDTPVEIDLTRANLYLPTPPNTANLSCRQFSDKHELFAKFWQKSLRATNNKGTIVLKKLNRYNGPFLDTEPCAECLLYSAIPISAEPQC